MAARVVDNATMLTLASLAALLALAQDGRPASEPVVAPGADTESALEIRFLANAGFLLRTADDRVLIDAFLEKPYSFYGALPAAAREKLLAGEAPLDGVDLALVSHAHGDHLQTGLAARFLASPAGEDVTLVSSPQVVDAIAKALAVEPRPEGAPDPASGPASAARARAGARDRLVRRLPAAGHTAHWKRGELGVTFLRLPHSGARWKDMHQIGHLIELGGFRVLHLGDAEADPANFAPYAKLLAELDVCLVPYWYFDSKAGRDLLSGPLSARLVVAMHIPPVEVTAVRERLANSHPDVIVFAQALEAKQLQPRKR